MSKIRILALMIVLFVMGCRNPIQDSIGATGESTIEKDTIFQDESETYDSSYFTGPVDGLTEKVESVETQLDEMEDLQSEQIKSCATEYARCLYPEMKISEILDEDVRINQRTYKMFTLLADKDLVCQIAYCYDDLHYYLYDSEAKLLIQIEYDEYGVRLVG